MTDSTTYRIRIGLEVHAALNTRSKIFCGCSTAFGAAPNTQVCPVCLGLPGALPVLNRAVIEKIIMIARALKSAVASRCRFHRKHYFYPDLPKNYQITQYDQPFGTGGSVQIRRGGDVKHIGIERVHLEEDAGKLVHAAGERGSTLIDYNRAGVPLVEIVSKPELSTPGEAGIYLDELRSILLYLGVSDCRQEAGSLRCDANVSVAPPDGSGAGGKTEIKNLNSFKSVVRSLAYEINRQGILLGQGRSVASETRAWDEARGATRVLRSKEAVHDYRYFPEPDIPPLRLEEQWRAACRGSLPELRNDKSRRFQREYGLEEHEAEALTVSPSLADYFERTADLLRRPALAARWIRGELKARLNERGLDPADSPVAPAELASLLTMIADETISETAAKTVLSDMFSGGGTPEEIVHRNDLAQISELPVLESHIGTVLRRHRDVVEKIRSGKHQAAGFLVGQVMRETKGKANPRLVDKLVKERLGISPS